MSFAPPGNSDSPQPHNNANFGCASYPINKDSSTTSGGGPDTQDGNWVWSSIGTYNPVLPSEAKAQHLETLFQSDTNQWRDNAMRLIYFEGTPYGFPGIHRAVISPTSMCVLSQGKVEFDLVHSKHLNCVELELPVGRMGITQRAATVKNRLFSLLDDQQSEARFTLEWLHLTPQQRRAKVLRFERGNETEAIEILRAVLQSQTDIWDNNESLLWRTQYTYRAQDVLPQEQSDALVFGHHPLDWNAPDLPLRLGYWKRIIWSYFLPHLDTSLVEFAQCVRDSTGHYDGVNTLSVESPPPTMHERLEAEMILRDWWNEKFTPLFFGNDIIQLPTRMT